MPSPDQQSAWSRATRARRQLFVVTVIVGVIASVVLLSTGFASIAGAVLGITALTLSAVTLTTPTSSGID